MKTLDEVIAELEDEELFADALHYLKQYRSDKAMWEADRKGYQGFVDSYIKSRDKHQAAVIELKHKEKEVNDILTDYVALKQYWAEQQENPPLTWDELKSMEGKPVWVEVYDPIDEKTGWHTASWKLIEFINDEYFDVRNSDGEQECFYKSENDCYCWQAYRKERG